MSQEQLAEKLGVSRQAVIKWEMDAGIPDIENIMAVSALFDISIDELLSNGKEAKKPNEYLFESITEYEFWIEGTYHYGLRELGIGYVLNFLISVNPLGFLTTWVYVKNNRSMLACIIFHLFVNTMQEKIAMTPQTKCVETVVVFVVAAVVILTNREMFFEKEHIGNLLDYKEEWKITE